jgi:hypothetical protein
LKKGNSSKLPSVDFLDSKTIIIVSGSKVFKYYNVMFRRWKSLSQKQKERILDEIVPRWE